LSFQEKTPQSLDCGVLAVGFQPSAPAPQLTEMRCASHEGEEGTSRFGNRAASHEHVDIRTKNDEVVEDFCTPFFDEKNRSPKFPTTTGALLLKSMCRS